MRLTVDVAGPMRARLIAQLTAATPELAARWAPVCWQLGLFSPGGSAAPTDAELAGIITHALKVLAADTSRTVYDDVRGLTIELHLDAGAATIGLHDVVVLKGDR